MLIYYTFIQQTSINSSLFFIFKLQLNIHELFGSIQLKYAIQTNLTMIPSFVSSMIDDNNRYQSSKMNRIHVKSMEIEAYYLV